MSEEIMNMNTDRLFEEQMEKGQKLMKQLKLQARQIEQLESEIQAAHD